MEKKRVVSLIIVLLLVLCAFIFSCIPAASLTARSGPGVKPGAPTEVKLHEDQLPVYVDLYDIYENSATPLLFNIWDGNAWSKAFQNDIITISIKANDTIEFAPKQDMFGADKIVLNATNSSSMLSTHHNLTVTIAPTNDPPVIEWIGNVKVTDTEFINLFLYQNSWFNETVIASDIDGDTLVFLDNTSAFDINYLTGNISFLPTNKDIGDIYVNITVSDVNDTNFEDWIIVQFTILNVNDPPIAQINYPLNGSYIYQDEYIQFEGDGFDPDIPFRDVLFFEWTSDLDGLLGVGEEIYIYYLSEGFHQITLNVTDSEGLYDEDVITIFVEENPYDKYSELMLYLNNDTLILKQNDTGTQELTISNMGRAEENVIFELKTYFEFEGKVEFEVDNITVESFDSKIVNVTVTVPSDTQIGFYPIEIYGRSDDDDYYDYWWEDQAIATLKVIVVSNQTEDTTKQASKPNLFLNDIWEYSINLSDEPLDLSGTVTLEITKDTKISVNDNTYDVFLMEMETDLEVTIDDDPYNSGFYDEIEVNMSGLEYNRKSDFASVKSEFVYEMEMDFLGETMIFETETNTTYDPPVSDLIFPLKPDMIWTVTTEVTTVTTTRYSEFMGEPEEDQDFIFAKKTASYICLGTENVTTPAGTFEAYLIMEFYNEQHETYENNEEPKPRPEGSSGTRQDIVEPGEGDVTIIYYAPDVNYTLKQVSYQQTQDSYDYDNWTGIYDWEQNTIMELTSYSLDNDEGGTEPPDDEPDSDDDGLPDDWEDEYDVEDPEEDSDDDGYTNRDEFLNGTDPTDSEDTPEDPIDLDEDGLPDSWEYYYDLDPSDPEDADEDTDDDGFSNRKEYQAHTSPINPDDHPPISSKKKDKDDGVFGLGKLGDLDLFYIYFVIIIIIIILLAMTFVIRNRRRQRAYHRQPSYEQRVARATPTPTPKTAASAGASVQPRQPPPEYGAERPPLAKPAQPQPPAQRYPEQPPPPPPPDGQYQHPRTSYDPTPQQYSPQYARQYPPRKRTPPPEQYY